MERAGDTSDTAEAASESAGSAEGEAAGGDSGTGSDSADANASVDRGETASATAAWRTEAALEGNRQDLINELWSRDVTIQQIVDAQRHIELGVVPPEGLAELQKAIERAIPLAVENTEGGLVALLGDKSATPEQLMQRVIGAARGHQLLGVAPSARVTGAMQEAGGRIDSATGSDVGSSVTGALVDHSSGGESLGDMLRDMTGLNSGDQAGAAVPSDVAGSDGSASDGPLDNGLDIPDTDPAPDEGGSASDGPLPENDDVGGDPTPPKPAASTLDMNVLMGGDPTGKGVESSGVTDDGRPYTDLEIGGGAVWRTYTDTNTWQVIEADGTAGEESKPASEPQASSDSDGTSDDEDAGDTAGAGDTGDGESDDDDDDGDDEDDDDDDDDEGDGTDDDGDTATARPTEDDGGAVAPDPFGIAASASPDANLGERMSIRYWDDKQPTNNPDDTSGASGGGGGERPGGGVTDPAQDDVTETYARDILAPARAAPIRAGSGAGPEYGPEGPIGVEYSGPPPTNPNTGGLMPTPEASGSAAAGAAAGGDAAGAAGASGAAGAGIVGAAPAEGSAAFTAGDLASGLAGGAALQASGEAGGASALGTDDPATFAAGGAAAAGMGDPAAALGAASTMGSVEDAPPPPDAPSGDDPGGGPLGPPGDGEG